MKTSTAIFTNSATSETYRLANVKSLEQAWDMVNFACSRNDWNWIDVTVRLEN